MLALRHSRQPIEGIGDQVSVGEHHTLARTCGAAGVEQARKIRFFNAFAQRGRFGLTKEGFVVIGQHDHVLDHIG